MKGIAKKEANNPNVTDRKTEKDLYAPHCVWRRHNEREVQPLSNDRNFQCFDSCRCLTCVLAKLGVMICRYLRMAVTSPL